MQFKHPEILYVLFALLIPVLIHLFQLQRFTKTPFTNVKFLKEIALQTRKSSRLKKWLVLLSRLAMFAALIIAFAQPYFSKNDTSKDWLTTIYLDNSISMQAKGERGELFKRTVQDIVEYLPENGQFSLLTNEQLYTDLSKNIAIEQLKNTTYSPVKTDLKTILLQTQQIVDKSPDKNHKLLLFSDFQDNTNTIESEQTASDLLANTRLDLDFVQLKPKITYNIAIDSVYVLEKNADNILLEILLTNQGEENNNVSVNALQNEIILAKSTLDIAANNQQKTSLRIPNKIDNITIRIDADDAYIFDNTYYVSFQQQDLINVLAIEENYSFLEKIYTEDEFNFTQKKPNEISFELIDKQQLVLLNDLTELPQQMAEKLLNFVNKGGGLVIIPNRNNTIDDLNSFFNKLKIGQLNNKRIDSLLLTNIHFSHPILKNVFNKKITNFQYPSVNTYFEGRLFNEQSVVSFENQQSFISEIKKGKGSIFWVAAPLDLKTSNFTKAPLIVPIFYNMGKQRLQQTQLSYRLGVDNKILVDLALQKDEVLHISGLKNNFIPMQEIHADKVLLYTNEQPNETGFYKIKNKDESIKNIAFNNPIAESNLSFLNMSNFSNTNKNLHQYPSVKNALASLSIEQSVQSYFKWFVLLAFIFLIIEILLLKYL